MVKPPRNRVARINLNARMIDLSKQAASWSAVTAASGQQFREHQLVAGCVALTELN
jgi:hypothetical protein